MIEIQIYRIVVVYRVRRGHGVIMVCCIRDSVIVVMRECHGIIMIDRHGYRVIMVDGIGDSVI